MDTIRGYFNSYLMQKVSVEHLVSLGIKGLRRWGVGTISAPKVHTNLKELAAVLKYNVKVLAQLVSQFF